MDERNAIEAGLLSAGLPRDAARRLATQSRYGYSFETSAVESEAEIPIGATKFGGVPDLPENTAWPWRPGYPADSDQVAIYERLIRNSEALVGSTDPLGDRPRLAPERHQDVVAEWRQSIATAVAPAALDFLAQFDLAEVAALGPSGIDLPSSGLLSIFFDAETQPWGNGRHDHLGTAVLYHPPEAGALSRRAAKRPPTGGTASGKGFAPLSARPHRWLMPVPADSAVFDMLNLGADARFVHAEWQAETSWPDAAWRSHRLAGWPTPIQGAMEDDCEMMATGGILPAFDTPERRAFDVRAAEWVLLAQVASDDDAGFQWGDSGELYFWIRRSDLTARRFDRVRTILQCF